MQNALLCGASLSKQWRTGVSNYWTGIWNGHCTHLTRVGSVVQSRLSYLLWMWLRETTSAAARAVCLALPFFLGLLSLCPFSSGVSAARRAPSCLILCFLFSSVIGRVFRGSLWECDGCIYRLPSKLHSKNTMVPYQLPLRFTLRSWLRLFRNTRA